MANPYIDVLVGTSWLDVGRDNHITYYLDNILHTWTTAEAAGYTAAMQSWANVANITIERVTSSIGADLSEGIYTTAQMNVFGFDASVLGAQEFPQAASYSKGYYNGDGATNGIGIGHLGIGPAAGTLSFETFVHEIGHGLGLHHPHPDAPGDLAFPGVTGPFSTGDFGLNQIVYSVMSYNEFGTPATTALNAVVTGHAVGPMAFDIAAIQQMYGANTTYQNGANTYHLEDMVGTLSKWQCIWDTGGIDTISYNGAAGVAIDLREATLLQLPGGGGYLSSIIGGTQRGGYTIAHGATIENATGSSAADILTGNAAVNVLTGNNGNDILDGGDGIDSLTGGLGDDNYVLSDLTETMTELAGQGTDTVSALFAVNLANYQNIENVRLIGHAGVGADGDAGNNVLTGNDQGNTLQGFDGKDTLTGGDGIDALIGGNGDDTFVLGADLDGVTDDQGNDTITSTITRHLFDFVAIENITLLGSDNVNAFGDAAANVLTGNSGNNVLEGGTGADTLIGGLGNDAYYLRDIGPDGRVVDFVTELANQGTDGVQTSVTVNLNEARFANIENGYVIGAVATNLGGNAANNVLVGNDAANSIYGLGGRDVMRGGLGADKFFYLFNADTGKTAATRDLIQDFTPGTDKIDLSALDANGAAAGNGTFQFQVTQGAAFTGVAGQLHFLWQDLAATANDKTIIEGDFNGDKVADFQIELTVLKTLLGTDFVL